MLVKTGHVEAIFRHPVAPMAGERLEAAEPGCHGLQGDRRLAFRRTEGRGGSAWLTASELPDLIRVSPLRRDEDAQGDLHACARTGDGAEMPLSGEELAAEAGRRCGAPTKMMRPDHGTFDEACLSLIATAAVGEIVRLAGRSPDLRRFRPDVPVGLPRSAPFEEDAWMGGALDSGERDDAPAIAVTVRDVRRSRGNLDPGSAVAAPEVLKAVVHAHETTAGSCGRVTRPGRLASIQPVLFHAAPADRSRG